MHRTPPAWRGFRFQAHRMSYAQRQNRRMSTEHDKQQYPIYSYEFRYRCERSGCRARYRAEAEVIRERHADVEIIGEPMIIREPSTGTFNPFRPRYRPSVSAPHPAADPGDGLNCFGD